MANQQKIGVLDYARSDYDGNNVTIEVFRRSKIAPYGISSQPKHYCIYVLKPKSGILFQKVPIAENESSFFLFYKTSEDGGTPLFEENYIAFRGSYYVNLVRGHKLWFEREWSHRDKLKGGEFSELWIGWLPEELQGLGKRTNSKQT